jgi:putative transposase
MNYTTIYPAWRAVYRRQAPASDNDLALMRRIDELFTAWPWLAGRMMRLLAEDGPAVNRKRGQRLMRLMGIVALGPKPRTSKRRRAIESSRICCTA